MQKAKGTASFYFDLASPLAYFAAERVLLELPVAAEWQPVLASELAPQRTYPEELREALERRAKELGVQPLRWPEPFPFDSTLAMRVATYAKQIGRVVGFAQAAFRQAYAGGRSLEDSDTVLIAAAACEMHPTAVLRGAELRGVVEQLERTTAHAALEGVRELPAIVLAPAREGATPRVFQGASALAEVKAELTGTAASEPEG